MKSTKERQKIAMQLKETVAMDGISNAIAKIPLMPRGSCGLIRPMLDIR